MGTRFLLTSDSTVPEQVKQVYLERDVAGTVRTTKVDGVPHRVLRTDLVEGLESDGTVVDLPAPSAAPWPSGSCRASRCGRWHGRGWR
jgi:NAD(P)H-dependent flavin oxidoreductase YrpB (nitropropane dioxygenase family)